jgi:thiol:disulfide interchange protein
MRQTFTVILMALAVFAFTGVDLPEKSGNSGGIAFFQGTWAEVLDESKETNKPIFVDAYAVWCGPCRWMAANVFTNAEVAEYYNTHFINYKFDMEKGEGPAFARKYTVMAYPTLYYLNHDGSVIQKVIGAQNAAQFLATGKGVVASRN